MGQFIALLVLLLLSAIISGSEVALFSIKGALREDLSEREDAASQRVLRLLDTPRQLLITILLLNTVVNVSAAILAAVATAQIALAYNLDPVLILAAEVVVLAMLLLILSEITPKLIATKHAISYSRWVSRPMLIATRALGPLTRLTAQLTKKLQQRFERRHDGRLSPEDVRAIAEISEAHGSIEEDERDLIDSIVEFGETTVREIMVSRLDVVALPVTATLEDALRTIRESGHSRLPLYVDHLDNILGVVYAKDLLPYLNGTSPGEEQTDRNQPIDWTRVCRAPMFVPMGRTLDDLLTDFQTKKTHLAIVVDEYGGTAGLVTLENVLEEIVGDIRDEHDATENESLIEHLEEGRIVADARVNLDELEELLGIKLDDESFDFETLGGLIYHLAGEIPSVGDEHTHGQLRFRVLSVENRRIGSVQIDMLQEEPEETTSVEDDTGR